MHFCLVLIFGWKCIGTPARRVIRYEVVRFFLKRDNFYKIPQFFASVNNFFKSFLKSFFSGFRAVISGDKKMKWPSLIVTIGPFHFFERRKRDLNPRAGFPTYTLSRGASSAS